MLHAVSFATVLVSFLCLSTAVKSVFSRDRPLVYNYHAEIRAGTTAQFHASQFNISGELYIQRNANDVNYPNAFVTALKNVRVSLYNGQITNYREFNKNYLPIPESARVLEDPFLIVYNETGHMIGVKISEDEPLWSKNMKQAMASIFQLDQRLKNLQLSDSPQKFTSKENTIYGDCLVDYQVYTENSTNEFIIKKISSPSSCSTYKPYVFDHVDYETCDFYVDKQLILENRKVLRVEKTKDEIIIKSIAVEGDVNDFAWKKSVNGRGIFERATFILQNDAINDFKVDTNFSKIPLIRDIIYQRIKTTYAEGTGTDASEGRSRFNQSNIISEVRTLLQQVLDYLDEYHLEAKPPEFENSRLINKIVYKMSLMTVDSFNEIHQEFTDPWLLDEETLKDLFFDIVSHVGTPASTIFIKNVISTNLKLEKLLNSHIRPEIAIKILAKFCTKIRNPSEELLRDIEGLIMPDYEEVVAPENEFSTVYKVEKVRSSIMVNFATLVFRTFKNTPDLKNNELLNRYIDFFESGLVTSKYYQRKMIAVQALGNIQLARSRDILASVIRGDLHVGELLDDQIMHLRLHAIWAIDKSLLNHKTAHELLWPIVLSDSLTVKLRLAAYDVLIRKSRNLSEILPIHSFMLNETSPHLQHYHYSTIKSIATAEDTCNIVLKVLANKLLSEHTKSHPSIFLSLSRSSVFSSIDDNHNYGHKFSLSYTFNPATGNLEVVTVEYSSTDGSQRTVPLKIQLIIDGLFEPLMTQYVIEVFKRSITFESAKAVLEDIRSKANIKSMAIDAVISSKGHVIYAKHYSGTQFIMAMSDLNIIYASFYNEPDRLFVLYDDLYQEQTVSEIGLPIIKQLQTPVMTLTKLTFDINLIQGENGGVFDLRLRNWRHSDHSLSFYNPINNVWHSVSRSVAMHVEFPIAIFLDESSVGTTQIKIPVLALTSHSTRGLMTYSQDYTAVHGDMNKTLKTHCPSCKHQEIIRKNVSEGASAKSDEVNVLDDDVTGFQFKKAVFDCEANAIADLLEQYLGQCWAMYLVSFKPWRFAFTAPFIVYRQYFNAALSAPTMGTCGILYRKTPSALYPTAWLIITLGMTVDTEQFNNLPILPNKTVVFHASYEATSAETNETNRILLLNTTFNFNPDRGNNLAYFNLTGIELDGKKFRMCLKYNETYNNKANDILNLEISSGKSGPPLLRELTFNSAHVDDDGCPSDMKKQIEVSISNDLSDNQKSQFYLDDANSACKKDAIKLQLNNSHALRPRTVNCLNQVIKYTTMRRFTLSAEFSEKDQYISTLANNIGNVEHSNSPSGGTRYRCFIMFDIAAQGSEMSGLDFDELPWLYLFDNSRFPVAFLVPYAAGELRICSLYVNGIASSDGNITPHNMSNHWVLASGEYINETFAILVRNVNGMINWKILVEDQSVEYSPGNNRDYLLNDKEQTTVDAMLGKIVHGQATKNPLLRFRRFMNIDFIEFRKNLVTILFSKDYITIIMSYRLEGRSGGLCRDPNNERNLIVSTL